VSDALKAFEVENVVRKEPPDLIVGRHDAGPPVIGSQAEIGRNLVRERSAIARSGEECHCPVGDAVAFTLGDDLGIARDPNHRVGLDRMENAKQPAGIREEEGPPIIPADHHPSSDEVSGSIERFGDTLESGGLLGDRRLGKTFGGMVEVRPKDQKEAATGADEIQRQVRMVMKAMPPIERGATPILGDRGGRRREGELPGTRIEGGGHGHLGADGSRGRPTLRWRSCHHRAL
jgi:hypothetical protein